MNSKAELEELSEDPTDHGETHGAAPARDRARAP